MTRKTSGHAVVIGASMAGLLAARVLSESFTKVTVLDRDAWTGTAEPRGGVPHGRHTHGLLARGREILDELFPDLVRELVEAGAVPGDLQHQVRWNFEGAELRQAPSDLEGLALSRPLLELHVRAKVERLSNVDIRPESSVRGLLTGNQGRRVCGVVTSGPENTKRESRYLPADLVVDASGRTSKMPEWLQALGFPRPESEKVRIDVTYATRTFRLPDDALQGDMGWVWGASAESPRGAALLAQEDGRWIVSMGGYHGERAPLELAGYLRYADTLDPRLGRVLHQSTPLDDGAYFRFPASVRHRYDKLTSFPAGLLVIGDAICSFNPVFGQGMTVAAMEALALRESLADGLVDIASRFFASTRKVIDIPWQLAVNSDLQLPGTEGRQTLATRVLNRYVSRLQRVAHDDAELATAFLKVANLKATPQTLLTPRVMARVLRSRAGRLHPQAVAVEPSTTAVG